MEVSSPIPKKHARIEIIPLIDIMFFLLASFMMVSLSQTTMKGMKVDLPTGQVGRDADRRRITSASRWIGTGISIWTRRGSNIPMCPSKLSGLYRTNPDTKIFIRGDREALHGNVTRLLDQIRVDRIQQDRFRNQEPGFGGRAGARTNNEAYAVHYSIRPLPKWQVWTALGGAFAIHALAVGIAALKPRKSPVDDLRIFRRRSLSCRLKQQPAPPEPTPPPEEEPEPIEQPPEPTETPEFAEEKPTPPPKPRTDKPKPVAPIARPVTAGAPTGPAPTGKAAMVFKPTVVYPYEAGE